MTIRTSLISEPIENLVKYASNGKLNIPIFQRSFIWREEQIKMFVESLIKGYPLGTFMFWENETLDKYNEQKQHATWVIDGQQRLTTLCLITGIKPAWYKSNIDQDQQKRRGRPSKNPTTWKELTELYPVQVNLANKEVRLSKQLDDNYIKITDLFREKPPENLQDQYRETYYDLRADILKRDIHIWKLPDELDIFTVAEIFKQVNKGGINVSTSDIILSYLATYNPDWVKNTLKPYLKDRQELEPSALLQLLFIIGKKSDVFIQSSVDKDFYENGIVNIFNNVRPSIDQFLQYEKGLKGLTKLTNQHALMLAIYSLYKNKDKDEAFALYLLALLIGRYTARAFGALEQDINTIEKEGTEGLIKDWLSRYTAPLEVTAEKIKDYKYNRGIGKVYSLILYLAVYEDSASKFSSAKPQITEAHHFFPKAVLKDKYKEDEINSLANIVFIPATTNKKLKKEPYQYIKEKGIGEEELKLNLIPIKEQLWYNEHYYDFISERAKLIAEIINRYLTERIKSVLSI